nr:PREDICTED: heat shock factor-binding protein 1 [Opisthocomus hoazin]
MKGHSNLVYQEKTEQNKDHPQLGEGRRKRTYQTFTPLCTPLLTGSASAGRIAESRNCRTEPHTGDTMAASAMSYTVPALRSYQDFASYEAAGARGGKGGRWEAHRLLASHIPLPTAVVQTLLQQMQDKFQTMSDQIIGRIDDMSCRIDDLEKNIADLMTQAGVEELEGENKTPAPNKS